MYEYHGLVNFCIGWGNVLNGEPVEECGRWRGLGSFFSIGFFLIKKYLSPNTGYGNRWCELGDPGWGNAYENYDSFECRSWDPSFNFIFIKK